MLHHLIVNPGQNLDFIEVNKVFATGLSGAGLLTTVSKNWIHSLEKSQGQFFLTESSFKELSNILHMYRCKEIRKQYIYMTRVKKYNSSQDRCYLPFTCLICPVLANLSSSGVSEIINDKEPIY